MPELPEVETIKRELSKTLKNKVVSNIEILWLKTISPTLPTNFSKILLVKKF
jgi:formamidopyrimidine-DNA glycosylase